MSPSDALKDSRPEVMRRWMAAVRGGIPEMRTLPDDELRDSFPLILDRMVHSLAGGERPTVMIEARMHAKHRWQQRVGLPAVMREHLLLLEAIDAVLVERIGHDLCDLGEEGNSEHWLMTGEGNEEGA